MRVRVEGPNLHTFDTKRAAMNFCAAIENEWIHLILHVFVICMYGKMC